MCVCVCVCVYVIKNVNIDRAYVDMAAGRFCLATVHQYTSLCHKSRKTQYWLRPHHPKHLAT